MTRRYASIAGIVLCLLLALGGQALADGLVPDASGAATNQAVGQAASSYLTGIRTFAAAVLWNRIDNLVDNYYSGVSLNDQRYMLTTIAVVQELDPKAVPSYYVGSWLLANNDRLEDGLAMAERGVEANPDAGVLRVSLAQLLQLYTDDMDRAVELAESALSDDMAWDDSIQQANGYLTARAVFEAAGRDDLAETAQAMADAVVIDPADIHEHDE